MRAVLLAAGLLMAVSCGGSPGAPTSPGSVSPRAVALDSGPYTLQLTLSTSGTPTCQNGFCSSMSLCTGTPSYVTASFDVTVERSGDTATVRVPGSASPLILSLVVSPA